MAGSVARLIPSAFKRQQVSYTAGGGQHRDSRGNVAPWDTLISRGSNGSRSPTLSLSLSGLLGSSFSLAMDEDALLRQLGAQSSSRRAEALKTLRANIQQNAGRLVFGDKKALFSTLNEVLVDARKDVKISCIQLVSEIVQGSDWDLDHCRATVLPKLIWCLRDDHPTVRKELVQTLHVYLKCTKITKDVFSALIDHGLENYDPSVRRATTVIFPILLTKEFNSESLFPVTLCLAKKLNGGSMDDPFTAFATMGSIKRHVGDQEFNSYLKRLPPTLRRDYNKLTEIQFEPHTNLNGREIEQEIEPIRNLKTSLRFRRGSVGSVKDVPLSRELSKDLSNLEFGIVPQELYVRLLDRDDYKTRAHGVEELKNVVSDLNFNYLSFPAILSFIGFLSNLLDDSNFKVVHGTLEIINLLVVKLNHDVANYVKPITSTTIKVLGDNKAVTKQEYMKVFMGLMKQVGPQRVLDMLLDNIKHKNSRVREEVLNIVIASLLTHPSEDFDLPTLCRTVAPTLTDSKRKIRHAALEAFAVLASSIGTNRTFLVKAVDAVEMQEDGDGLMAAVQARLARRTLPKLTAQGLVEYAIQMPTSAHGRGVQIPLGSDTEWLLATGRTQSAHGDQETDFWNYGSPSPISDECISSRRVLSAGRGKNKLPWENANSITRGSIQQTRLPNTAPMEQVQPYNDEQQSPKLKTTQLMQAADDVFFTRKSNVRSAKLNEGLDLNLESTLGGLRKSGFGESSQPRALGKRGVLGYSRMLHAQSTSVDSDLQYFGIGNHLPQDKASTSPVHTSITGGYLKKIHEPSFHELSLTLSNSWPNKQFEGLHNPSPQRKLINHLSEELPILGDSLHETRSPIPLKPTLVKSISSRRGLIPTKPVPPIPRCTSPMVEAEIAVFGNKKGTSKPDSEQLWEDDGGKKIEDNLKLDLSSLDKEDETDHEEMMISLKSLRNSAAKKRAKLSSRASDIESPDSDLKLELGVDSTSRTSSPYTSTYIESGVYSQESLMTPLPCDKKIMSDSSSLSGSKQRLGGVLSGKARQSASVENNSVSGLTLHDKATSDVSVVGQRMSYRNAALDSEEDKRIAVSPSGSKFPSKEQQKPLASNKAVRGLTGSTISIQQMNSHEVTPGSEDTVVIVGKGVFGSALVAPLTCSQATVTALDNGDDTSSPRHKIEPPSGIYGRAVHQNSHTSIVTSESEREICMSKSARDKMKQRKREGTEHLAEQGDQEYNDQENRGEHLRLKNTESNKMGTESPSSSGDVLLKNDHSLVDTSHLSPTHLKRTSSIRKNRTPSSPSSGENSPLSRVTMRKDPIPSVANSPDVADPDELRPFSKPELALSEALKQLADDDWEKKIEGLNCFRSLCTYHPDAVIARLHETVFAVVQEVKNLRSGVSRVAMLRVADMFTTLKKNMDQELDNTVRTLLHKAGESSIFIREDVDKALNAMVVNVTPARALSSLISGGLNHLNPVVRKCAAMHFSILLERMEPSRLLPGMKDATDRIIPAVAKFAQDVSPETRYYGRKMLFLMMSSHQDLDKVLEKHLTPKDLPCIRDIVSNLRQKGLGEMPLDTPSAKGRRSHPSSGGSFRASANSREVHSLTGRDAAEAIINLRDYTWKPTQKNLIENAEYIKDITNLLGAKDFRDRSRGIEQLVMNCQNNQDLVITNIVKIFDAFRPRLHDFNSKVNQTALEAMRKIIPLLKENLGQVLNMVVPAIVDNNLNSKNPGIYNAAISVVQTLVHHIDNSLLLQLFCNKALFLNGKAKQDMTEKLADMVPELYTRKSQVVEQKVLPVLWHLLGNMTNSGSIPGSGGNIRVAAVKLANVLFAAMGQNLIDQASNQQQNIGKTLQDLLDYNA